MHSRAVFLLPRTPFSVLFLKLIEATLTRDNSRLDYLSWYLRILLNSLYELTCCISVTPHATMEATCAIDDETMSLCMDYGPFFKYRLGVIVANLRVGPEAFGPFIGSNNI